MKKKDIKKKKHVSDGPCMQVDADDADVKQQAEPMFTQETREGHGHQIIFLKILYPHECLDLN